MEDVEGNTGKQTICSAHLVLQIFASQTEKLILIDSQLYSKEIFEILKPSCLSALALSDISEVFSEEEGSLAVELL